MTKQDVEMKEESQKNGPDSEEPQAEVSKEEKERLALEGELHVTVELPASGHRRDQKKCPLKRGVRLWEVKNVVFVCS